MEIQGQARVAAQNILAKAQETVEMELSKAKVTLRDQVVEMTLEALERMLRKKLDAQTDRLLIEASLEELEQQSTKTS